MTNDRLYLAQILEAIPRLRSTISTLASLVESQNEDEASADGAPTAQ
ncbi:MAG: hypothetical protein WCP21_07915 [Armatimonadota bacterium]